MNGIAYAIIFSMGKGNNCSKVSLKRLFDTRSAFTIIELLIVVVVIAILAVITIVSYNGITNRATEAAIKSDLRTAASQLSISRANYGSYPSPSLPSEIKASNGASLVYTSDGQTFCLTASPAVNNVSSFHITDDGLIVEGPCPIINGSIMQLVTTENCPDTRTRVVDARDNHTYWLQKLADGKCWMLTSLAYGGGGTNTYDDIVTINFATSGTSYTEPRYYTPTNANPTVEPSNPSTSTDGGITDPQYGYLYNWCAAMGGQPQACQSVLGSDFTSTSVCPAGWRLPTGETTTSEFTALASAMGWSSSVAGVALLQSSWLAQRSGYWNGVGHNDGGTTGHYWSSTQSSATSSRYLYFTNSGFNPAGSSGKSNGYAIRCVTV